eukprot:Gregarina_sp_Poly_1__2148@NODE_156_length_12377_cov_161_699350_g138_i0_p4_GENE_NODE_156_length_12377_cov_161_699350_g138_i0NODE_156_length_12377_cov_161_699350_g138_i0_p4_ORF_typecomplete_len502_score42_90ANTAR/PF03861_14/0_16Fbox/PF00646_33/0_15Fbox/PF00646_33/3_7e03_NODE_156_length_12377_cov_161_699350_g138_i015783083
MTTYFLKRWRKNRPQVKESEESLRFNLAADELNSLLEFLSLHQVLRFRLLSREFKHFIDREWSCRRMILSNKLLADMSPTRDPDYALRLILTNEPRSDPGAGFGAPDSQHYMVNIYQRCLRCLKYLKWEPGDRWVNLCPASYCEPKYRVNAPNLDALLMSSCLTLEHLELRCCWPVPTSPIKWVQLSTPRFPRLRTLIHTTEGPAKGAIFASSLQVPECPVLRNIELSSALFLSRSCLSELCKRLYRSFREPWDSFSVRSGESVPSILHYTLADYSYTTCGSLLTNLRQGTHTIDNLCFTHLWGVAPILALVCLAQIAETYEFPVRFPTVSDFEEICVSELSQDFCSSLQLLDQLAPHFGRRSNLARCKLRLHIVPESHTPTTLGRNIANRCVGGEVEEILATLIQALLNCDEDEAQGRLRMWARSNNVDLFPGSLLQPRIRKSVAIRPLKHLRTFRSVELNLSCIPRNSGDAAAALQLLKDCNLGVCYDNECLCSRTVVS